MVELKVGDQVKIIKPKGKILEDSKNNRFTINYFIGDRNSKRAYLTSLAIRKGWAIVGIEELEKI